MSYEQKLSVYWNLVVKEARELIASAAKSGHEYVGVQRARAIVEVDEELRAYREHPMMVLDRNGSVRVADFNEIKQEIYNGTP